MLVYHVEFQIYGCLDIVTFDGYRSLTAKFSLLNTSCQRIYSKMGVKNVSDMLRKATELGII